MKKLIPAALALAILGSAASPAMAQQWQNNGNHNGNNHGYNNNGHNNNGWRNPAVNAQIRDDINGLRQAIDRAAARRTISGREAVGLRQQARNIQTQYADFARGGLDRREVNTLQDHVNKVRDRLRMERRDWDGRRG